METNRDNQIEEIPANSEKKQELPEGKEYDDKGRIVFKKGFSGNPAGKPAGLKNFETDFLEAVGKIAEANNITRAEAMEILLRKAYSEAKNGQFNFYKDIVDRLYGKVVEKTDITSKGEAIIGMMIQNANPIQDEKSQTD